MPHDKRGEELKVGDVVMVPCTVKAIHLTEDYCNVDLVTKLTMPPQETTQTLTLNSRQTIKPTATHRFAEYGLDTEGDRPEPVMVNADLLSALKAVMAVLKREAPGTPLNNQQYDQLGIDAYKAIAAAERVQP